jgi:hypothetical protein
VSLPTSVKAKPARNGDERFAFKHYVGVEVPLKNGKPGRLGKYDIRRIQGREVSNRSRVRSAGLDAVVDAVDFIGVCIAQGWLCWICKQPMDAALHGSEPEAISVEHDPAVSVCREHTLRTVKGAHQRCNHAKAAAEDTSRAAKIKRVSKDERHATLMRMKATMTPAAYRREKLKVKFAKGPQIRSNRKIEGRGFDRSLRKKFSGEVVRVKQ